ncbi:MAG: transglycosylase domain-containing protein [Flavobacteriales bacterium]|nr:transglycosylase domain-containing protein [Flavobacteriales bacterium]
MSVKRKLSSWFIRLFWMAILGPILGMACGVWFASMGWFGPLPSFEELENPQQNLATEIYASDGVLLGKFFYENRTPVTYEEISHHVVNALISTEDERFREHSAIDAKSLGRAIVGALTGRSAGGGSTITQQLSKMLFTDVSSNIIERVLQKFKEWVISVRLERNFTKDEILTMYLNKFDFLYLAVGVKSAAKIYFNTTPDQLTIEQAALLVGMAKNPSRYNPKRFPENALKRRNVVFGQMHRNGIISEVERDSLIDLPIELDFKRANHNDGLAPYFREHLRRYMKGWLKENKKPDGTEYNLYAEGLKIFTTIDSRMQQYAEEAVATHMPALQEQFYEHWDVEVYEEPEELEEGEEVEALKEALEDDEERYTHPPFDEALRPGQVDTIMLTAMKRSERYRKLRKQQISSEAIDTIFNKPAEMQIFTWDGSVDTTLSPMDSILHYKYILQTGMMSMDPQTGYVKAWVGGIDHHYFKYDHVKDAKRQVGSTFKPFVYATAIDQHNYSPCMNVPNVQVAFEKERWGLEEDWIPRNSGDVYGGELNLKQALAKSINTVTAYLMKQVGPRKVRKMARAMGLEGRIPPAPSICLGTPDVSIFEMVGAYGTFANKGVYTSPVFLNRIEDKNGVVLDQISPTTKEVLSEEKAYVMLDLMQGVTRNGSGVRLRWKYGFRNQIAGKTGTTQNQSDGWFIGVVPNLVTGVWTGAEDRAVHFRTVTLGQGANVALPIWGEYMKRVYRDVDLGISKADFKIPNDLSIELDCAKFEKERISFDDELEDEEF